MSVFSVLAYITIGLTIGWLSRTFSGKRGITMGPSLFFGVLGSLSGAAITHLAGLAGAGFLAAMVSVGVLFMINTFRQKDPIFDTEIEG